MDKNKKIILKKGKEIPFLYRHPWVFSGAIKHRDKRIKDGDTAALYGSDDTFIAWGSYNSRSSIAMRLYSWNYDSPLNNDLLIDRIGEAVRLRTTILGLDPPVSACRLVFSEGDGISGLIIDRYGPYLVMQIGSLGLMERIDAIVQYLIDTLSPKGIFLRNEMEINRQEGIERSNGLLFGSIPETGIIEIEENGLVFVVDINEGQKTGFYLDQRENRAAAAAYFKNLDVLDVCCNTGAFSIYAAKAGAKEITGIDISRPSIEGASRNASRNGFDRIRFIKDDAFRYLQNIPVEKKYDAIILDPPRFAQSHGSIDQAVMGYVRLNGLAMKSLQPGGFLVTCSCSGRVSEDLFERSVLEAAHRSNRFVQIIEKRSQPPDHPVSIHCPESRYLKCLICSVH